MYVSSVLLNQAWDKFKANQEKTKEQFQLKSSGEASAVGAVTAMYGFMLLMSIILFILELVLVVYAVLIAIKCTQAGGERAVHVIMAITFTLPYMLIMSTFNECGKDVLRGGLKKSLGGFGGECGCSGNKTM